ncbi:hypothetical protein D9M68_635900 [compost metagenome]
MRTAYERVRNALRNHATARRFKGSLRPHDEALELGVIDPHIRELVAAFNVDGIVSSISSCEGHRRWGLSAPQTAFIMFSAEPALAARIATRILVDQRGASELHHYWKVDATFNADGELVFCLSCPEPRFRRSMVDADFKRLKVWVEEILRSWQESLIREPEVSDCDHD